jgi:hypothetical protein
MVPEFLPRRHQVNSFYPVQRKGFHPRLRRRR